LRGRNLRLQVAQFAFRRGEFGFEFCTLLLLRFGRGLNIRRRIPVFHRVAFFRTLLKKANS
jgi:hypothetical protein